MARELLGKAVERQRRAWIEVLAWFEGGVTARRLAERLGLSLPTAQRAITDYQVHRPGWLCYDRSSRVHRMVRSPVEASPNPADYLDLLRGVALVEGCAPLLLDEDVPLAIHLVERFLPRRASGPALRLCEALRSRQVVQAAYRSLAGLRFLTLSPHRLVYADHRYHVRAFLHDGSGHTVDLVLGRFLEASIQKGEFWVGPEHDHEWHRQVRLKVCVNPDLSDEARLAVALDWMIDGETLEETMPEPLVFYVERELQRHRTRDLPTFKIEKIVIR
jgi:hypothetical protein